MLHVFAALRDHLSFLDESQEIDIKNLPNELQSFFVSSYLFLGNTENVRRIVNDLFQNQKNPNDTFALASTLVDIGDLEVALELLDQVPTDTRKSIPFQYLEARVLSSQKDYGAPSKNWKMPRD